jgi:transcriptional regulator with XRE-family HTH domain
VIIDLIQKSGKDEKELKTLLNITSGALQKYLSGQRPLTIDQLATVAEWLDLSLVSLLNSAFATQNTVGANLPESST